MPFFLGELDAMCDCLSLPTIFFTVSSADMRWPRLRELMTEFLCSGPVIDKCYFEYVVENPKICSDYFYEMFCMFFEAVVLGAYQVVDYWYRFEWQVQYLFLSMNVFVNIRR